MIHRGGNYTWIRIHWFEKKSGWSWCRSFCCYLCKYRCLAPLDCRQSACLITVFNSTSFLRVITRVIYGALFCIRREKQWPLPAARCDPHQFSWTASKQPIWQRRRWSLQVTSVILVTASFFFVFFSGINLHLNVFDQL